ncbi:uncharacterized protein LTR77_004511 [Saxophila tyrrhenica]|uniref:Peptidase C45 hydrolase domain-containing protein n=1 Tax=Saxophila tyrrhenica TaxID=1690608 RepID=A0AAV9PFV9_9PEZI|nr:hypothetical protein LTR77_004511 [Saxophila tyrrhenica]
MAPYLGSPDEPAINGMKLKLRQIECSGTPYEIGFKHGREATSQVHGTIAFYTSMFQTSSKLEWPQVRQIAMDFEPNLRRKWPRYVDEMQGLADGADVELADIIACNVRTEIAFGMFSDGCTALSWRTEGASFLAQNWDWMEAQKANLVVLTIKQEGKPGIKLVTEAGLIGKIGLNDAGVGVCLNAIRVKGMDATKLPCHLGLRMVLESRSREEAVRRLEEFGIASSCHMLIADAEGGIGLEWSSSDVQKCEMNGEKQVFHSNHFLLEHPGVGEDTQWIKDSGYRVTRIEELAKQLKGAPTKQKLFEIFKDESNYPGAICRAQKAPSTSASLFNIIVDLKAIRGDVTLGRPTEPEDFVQLAF